MAAEDEFKVCMQFPSHSYQRELTSVLRGASKTERLLCIKVSALLDFPASALVIREDSHFPRRGCFHDLAFESANCLTWETGTNASHGVHSKCQLNENLASFPSVLESWLRMDPLYPAGRSKPTELSSRLWSLKTSVGNLWEFSEIENNRIRQSKSFRQCQRFIVCWLLSKSANVVLEN